MIELLTSLFSNNAKVLILGFGKEGKSTYGFVRKYFPKLKLAIADSNPQIANNNALSNDNKLEIITGSNYLNSLSKFDIIIKSPGVKIGEIRDKDSGKITSQTDLFLQCYANQVIGVTGTKGKSTTASLVKHFLDSAKKKSLLLGNIGVPAFDRIENIENDTIIVYELSAHQLEYLHKSPHIAVLLNIFPEHLDYFNTFDDYKNAKLNICNFQNEDDYLILHNSLFREKDLPESTPDNYRDRRVYNQKTVIRSLDIKSRIIEIPAKGTKLKIENPPLVGDHNLINIEVALKAVEIFGIERSVAINSLSSFKGLPHRLENIGIFGGIIFVNDSISTIPESTIAAVNALPEVDTIILGGWDRGLDYKGLIEFLTTSDINNFIFLGKAGDRMYDVFNIKNVKNLFKADSIESAFKIIAKNAAKGRICLLSPAAASYDQFHNFEHRGDAFRELAMKL